MVLYNNAKGFTLMEILAVMLVVAVIATFLVPAVRSARAEVYYQQAKAAAVKMAEAMRSYYKDSKGYVITGEFSQSNEPNIGSCPNDDPARTGVAVTSGTKQKNIARLFECNYLSWKDFEGLPYRFKSSVAESNTYLVEFQATDRKAGRYYKSGSDAIVFHVKRDMTVDDSDEEKDL